MVLPHHNGATGPGAPGFGSLILGNRGQHRRMVLLKLRGNVSVLALGFRGKIPSASFAFGFLIHVEGGGGLCAFGEEQATAYGECDYLVCGCGNREYPPVGTPSAASAGVVMHCDLDGGGCGFGTTVFCQARPDCEYVGESQKANIARRS